MTDEATAVMRRQPRGGDGIFDGAGLGEKRGSMGEHDDALNSMLSMSGGTTTDAPIEDVVAGMGRLSTEQLEKMKLDIFNEFMKRIKTDYTTKQEECKHDYVKRDEDIQWRRQDDCLDQEDSPTHESNLKVSPNTPQRRRRYQATVEDDTEDTAHDKDSAPSSPRESRPDLQLVTQSTSPPHSGPPSSVGSTESPGARPRLRVRFSDRPLPAVVHNRAAEVPLQLQSSMRPADQPDEDDDVLSAVDRKWGVLFTDKAEPTKRLYEVLRGLANYLVAEYSPRNSLVITPDKLHAFYRKYKLDVEPLYFHLMFENRTKSLACLSQLYMTLGCEFHLVQEEPGALPDVPGLTPAGLAKWLIILVQVFPDDEARRLAAVVEDLPIEAAGLAVDGKPERVPKQLSRHLLPAKPVEDVFYALAQAVLAWKKAMGISDAAAASPTSPRDANRGSRGDAEIEVTRRRSEGHYRESERRQRPEDTSRRYSTRHASRLERPQQSSLVPLLTSGRSTHSQQRSPASGSRYRRETPRTAESGGNYRVSSEVGDQLRRTREEEYRLAQGRDRWGSLDSSTPRGGSGASRRRSVVVSTPQTEDNPTYEEYLTERGGGYGV